MTSPVPPPAEDQVREVAAEAVRHRISIGVDERVVFCSCGWSTQDEGNLTRPFALYERHVADALLPAVSRLVDKARADELRLLAQKFYESRQRWSPNTLGDWMLDRADVISPPTRSSVRLTEGK